MTYPAVTLVPSEIVEIFDGEQWRAVDPPGNAAFYTLTLEGSEGSKVFLALGAQIAGQGQASWLSVWIEELPPVRYEP